ncbi:hypothetical protein HYV81_00970 [Candidatus Woesearchaeota archaeon]|nr:hypothetical protein [Candidatus Woesearchaeota archaeon]
MIDLRRVAIIFIIAVLYAIFVNVAIGAFYPAPMYEDFCTAQYYPEKPYPRAVNGQVTCPEYDEPTQEELDKCAEERGYPDYQYNPQGCPVKYLGCNYCQRDFDAANEKYNLIYFIISSILALVAVGIGLVLPTDNSLNEWIGTGFMLGGLITLFFGTFRSFEYLGRYVKPAVILAELIIVVYLSYKKLQDIKKPGKKKR